MYCVYRLRGWVRIQSSKEVVDTRTNVIGGSAMEGIRLTLSTPYFRAIAITLVCANFLGVFIYVYMAEIVGQTFDSTNERTQVFAWIDASINALSFIGQLILVKHAVQRFGVGATLALLPVVSLIGMLVLAYLVLFLPTAVGAARTSLLQVNPSMEEAARGLGQTPLRVMTSITFPLVRPGILAGAALVFLLTMKELPATLILSPIGFTTLATAIWDAASEAFFARAAAPALLLILASSVPLAVLMLRERR